MNMLTKIPFLRKLAQTVTAGMAVSLMISLPLALSQSVNEAKAQSATDTTSKRARFHPGHYVLVIERDPSDQAVDKALRLSPKFRGVQVIYNWKTIEPSPGHYDTSAISRHLALARRLNKHLIIQLQTKWFNLNPYAACPTWLTGAPKPGGGRYNAFYTRYKGNSNVPQDVQPVFWDPVVNYRLVMLARNVGYAASHDRNAQALELINLTETAASTVDSINAQTDIYPFPGKDRITPVVARIFNHHNSEMPNTIAMQYNNFFFHNKEEELLAEQVRSGVGLGGPDLRTDKPSLNNVVYPRFLRVAGIIPTLLAVQWGDTFSRAAGGGYKPADRNDVIDTLNLAKRLKLNYVTWLSKSDYIPLVKSVLEDRTLVNQQDPAGGLASRYPAAVKPLLE